MQDLNLYRIYVYKNLYIIASVSYTHLDVYKRQPYMLIHFKIQNLRLKDKVLHKTNLNMKMLVIHVL